MTNNIAGIARSAVLVSMSVSLYSGRKQDNKTRGEIVASNGSGSTHAASVYKNLFADCLELSAIVKYQARLRAEHYRATLPWDDTGVRLLPTSMLMDYQDVMGKGIAEFDALVKAFLLRYDTLVSAAAFQLGNLFDRSEYPSALEVAKKFHIDVTMAPLPTSGDFRLDIETAVQDAIAADYEAKIAERVAAANQDAWTRLHTVLTNMSTRLDVTPEGERVVFRNSLVSNAEELCALLTKLNIAQDPALERARARMEEALLGVTPSNLREDDNLRAVIKRKVDTILSDYDWGCADDM